MNFENLRCGSCGLKKLELANIKGSCHPYKQYLSVKIVVDCFVPCCSDCSNIVLRSVDIKALDEAIERSLELGTETQL